MPIGRSFADEGNTYMKDRSSRPITPANTAPAHRLSGVQVRKRYVVRFAHSSSFQEQHRRVAEVTTASSVDCSVTNFATLSATTYIMSNALARIGQSKPEIRLAQAVSEFEAGLSSGQKTSFRNA